jgi:UDP-N-acetylglucosamine 3-dehydrogenase
MPPVTKPIGVAVIGCGDIARVRYFPWIAALSQFELRGAWSRTRSTCEEIVGQYGGKAYDGVEALLGDRDVDAVIIATPHPSHVALAVAALDAGKHVLVEKPMATSLADADRICRATRGARGVLMALPLDSSPPVDTARRLIEAGAIGRISGADAVLAHHGPVHAPWFYDLEQAGWGVLADLGIYLISQLTYLFGPAESVSGRVATLFPERNAPDGRPFPVSVDDNAAALITWPGNILGAIRANWCSPADRRNFIWETRIYGSTGIIFIDMARPESGLIVFSPDRPIEGGAPIIHNRMSGCYQVQLPEWDLHRAVLAAFAERIANGNSSDDAMRERHVIDIIDKIYRSSREGTAQVLDPWKTT